MEKYCPGLLNEKCKDDNLTDEDSDGEENPTERVRKYYFTFF
jgi:hypothetical protein